MIEFASIEKDILTSWDESIHQELSPYIKKPLIQLNSIELEKILEKEYDLISVFNECTYEILNLKCCKNFMFMLFDKEINMIANANYSENKKILDQKGLVLGTSFKAQSVGVNAVNLAVEKDSAVFINKNQYFCVFLRDFYSSAIPLKLSGDSIGYFSILSTNEDCLNESRYLLDILSSAMVNKLHLEQCRKYKNMLSKLQLKILSFLANGYTELEISKDLNYSLQSIKYHKHEIYQKFNVKNTPDAITKLYRYHNSDCNYK
jgi:transcriptional regulator of acetoin/glycerol metabolism